MNKKTAELYEAHVAYVMSRLEGKHLKELITEESGFIFDRLAKVKLSDVITKEEILDFEKRNFEHRRKASDPVKVYVKSLRDDILQYLKKSDATLSDLVDRKDYDRLVAEIAKLKDIREELIHRAVSNPLYAEVIADILANGIKSFTSEEGLAGKIPGASSFFKMGQGLLGGLQDTIDRNTRKFITENIQRLTAQSEKFVKNLIDDRKVRELGQQLWDKTAKRPIGPAFSKVRPADYEGFEPIAEDMANHFLRSDFVKEVNERVIDHFLKENGSKSLQQILIDIEITREDVVRESVELFTKIADQARKDGSLEDRVRKHLKDFYESEEAGRIIG